MKGKITIEADGNHVSVTGNMGFRGEQGIYEIICCLAESLGVNSTEDWVKIVVYACARGNMSQNGSQRIEIRVPIKNKEGEKQ